MVEANDETDHDLFRSGLTDLNVKVAVLQTKLEENAREHTEIKSLCHNIVDEVKQIGYSLKEEMGRRSALSWVGGTVLAAFGAVVVLLFGQDAAAWVHNALHLPYQSGGK